MSTFDPTSFNSEVESVQFQATRAYHEAMDRVDGPRELIREIWAEMFQRSQLPHSPESRLVVARQALEVMRSFGELEQKHRHALAAVEGFRAMGGGVNYDPQAVAAAATAAINSHPVLKRFQKERDEAREKREAKIEANRQVAERQRLRDLPSALLTSLRSRGVTLSRFRLVDQRTGFAVRCRHRFARVRHGGKVFGDGG